MTRHSRYGKSGAGGDVGTFETAGSGWIGRVARRARACTSRLLRYWPAALTAAPALILCCVLTAQLNRTLTDDPNAGDAVQNVRGAYNLAYHGVLSMTARETPNPPPSNRREPLPPALMALHIKLHPQLATGLTVTTLNEAPYVRLLKQHNLIWAWFGMAGLVAIALAAVRQRPLAAATALAAVWLSYDQLFSLPSVINRMTTEIQAAPLLVWSTFALVMAFRRPHWGWFALSGVMLGALALTKSSFLYVAVAAVAVLCIFNLWRPLAGARLRTFRLIAVMAVALAVTVTPWMVRNKVLFDSFSIAGRGTGVFYYRANLSTAMTWDEYVGAYVYYAQPWARRRLGWLGYTNDDFQAGGRLVRIYRGDNAYLEADRAALSAGRPEDAVSLYYQSRAEVIRLNNVHAGLNADDRSRAVDSELASMAAEKIHTRPLAYLRSIPLFLWYGTGVWGVPILILAAIGLLWRRPVLTGLTLISAGGIAFLGLVSHFLPRYGMPFVPVMLATFCILVAWTVAAAIPLGAAALGRAAARAGIISGRSVRYGAAVQTDVRQAAVWAWRRARLQIANAPRGRLAAPAVAIGACLVVVAAYFAGAGPTASHLVDTGLIGEREGEAFVYSAADFSRPFGFTGGADSVTDPDRSTLTIMENGAQLGPAHANHDAIASDGGGRFSHWADSRGTQYVVFSASDNSDPRTNGRTYSLTYHWRLRAEAALAAGVILACAVLYILWLAAGRPGAPASFASRARAGD